MNVHVQETDSQTSKLWLPKRKGGGGGGGWIGSLGLARVQCCVWNGWSAGTCGIAQYSVTTYMGKESEKEWICVHVYLNHFAVQQK